MRKCLFGNDSGNVAVIFAVSLLPIALSAGVAIDYMRMVDTKSKLQASLDAAALAGAAFDGGSVAQRADAAKKSFQANIGGGLLVSTPDISFAANQITVAATVSLETALMNISGITSTNVAAKATDVYSPATAPTCLIALEPSEKEAVFINSDSKIDAPNCAVYVNSSNGQALYGNSNGDIIAKKTCVTGGTYLDSGSTVTPAAKTCPAIADPLVSLPVPPQAAGACNYMDKTVSGTATLSPGVYCGKLELNSGAVVTFQPGIYIKKDGEFIVNSGSSASGNGVMFYFTGNNNSRFNINSGSHIDFKALSTGTYAGMVFFQQRNISGADFSILNSDSTSKVEGVIYLPSTSLKLNSNGNLSAATPWTSVIADKIEVNSISTLRLNANYAASTVPVPAGLGGGGKVRLTE